MPLELELRVPQALLSTLAGLRVEVELHNRGEETWELPATYDRTDALTFEVYGAGGEWVRRMSGVTHQAMMTTARIEWEPLLDTLPPGETWRWDLDLSSFHYPLPPGEYEVFAAYRYPPAGVGLRSGGVRVRVTAPALRSLFALRDNPVLDGLTLLFRDGQGERAAHYLRQHNYDRPLASWYSARVLEGEPVAEAFCAATGFFQTASFAPFSRRWLVWQSGETLRARVYYDGAPTADERTAPCPPGRTLLPSAFYDEEETLYVFFRDGAGALECYRFEASALVPLFSHPLPPEANQVAALRGYGDAVHLGLSGPGLRYQRLGLQGAILEDRSLLRTRLSLFSCEFDAERSLFKALFSDTPHGRTVRIVAADVARDTLTEYEMPRLRLRGDPTEMAMDQHWRGRLHLLVATGDRRLYYYSQERGPALIAEGEERFYPRIIVVPGAVYLGYYTRAAGYRFAEFSRRHHGRKLVPFGEH